ncbi:hypothetical protein B9Z19DRAFT_1066276 [Tuber borchii]|uniref:Uncharacterized protein n=1 Tax=Tuber borchii TaxID=42251 RepID=A0A2T6ZN54_TUBBO|nr:hypothetical protein B9Z19DRAFT_1066276 [Tuber borchii]
MTYFLPFLFFLAFVLSLASGGWKGFYKWVAHGILDRSQFPREYGKQVNVKQESATFYDSRPAQLMFKRSGIQAGTVTQEGYNTSATSAIKASHGASRGDSAFGTQLRN